MDELYNYNFGRNIANGYLVYKDFNCVVFPIFPWIIGAIITIFGQKVIIYRISQVVLCIITEKLSFDLFRLLNKENHIFRYLICLLYFCLIVIWGVLEYNFFCIMLLLLILNIEIKEKKTIKDTIMVGLLLRN